jgi:leucyl/phenylalanyl-tRNA--protein transferase
VRDDFRFDVAVERRRGRWDVVPEPVGPSRYAWPPADAWPSTGDVVARGADLDASTLIDAYRRGMFPMEGVDDDDPAEIYWWSPQLRGIIPLDALRVTRSMRRSARRYSVRINGDFERTVLGCASRVGDDAWITERFVRAYVELHRLGWAHSIETYDEHDVLVGGLYGVRIGRFFAGESMFHLARDASKVALMALVDLMRASDMSLLDAQWLTPHLDTLGAVAVPRESYLRLLASAVGTR